MADKIYISVEEGINPVTKNIDISFYKKRTVKPVVVRTNKKPRDFDFDNPDPTLPFQGKDGNWYKIIFPEGKYNCYLFAMGWGCSAPNSGYGIPGFLVGRIPRDVEEIKELIIKDLNAVNRKVYEIYEKDEIPEYLPEANPGTYWIKVYFSDKESIGSFHVSRKHEESGRWLHKMGWEAPAKVVCDNYEIGYILDHISPKHEEIKAVLEMYPKELIQAFANQLNIPIMGITKSKWQDGDDKDYKAYSPDENPKGFTIYRPEWVMRVDE